MYSKLIARRSFLRAAVLGSTVWAAAPFIRLAVAGPTKPLRDPFDGLKVGLTSYTLRKFSLDEAIAMTNELGVKYISLKDMHLPFRSTTAERQLAHQKITDAGLILMGGGVIYMKNNPDEIRAFFEYAKDAGMSTIVCSPDPEALDTIEKMAIDYDIRVAIHNHGPGDKKYPSPLDVLRLVKHRDRRMGVCMDVGHTVRLGEDPVVVLRKCGGRLYEFHMKDVTSATPDGKPTEVGKGVIDISAVLRALVKMKYPYHVALEYEANGDAPMPGVKESIVFMRGVLATI
jgi:sugar phosphate isomerase/epimerase